MSLIIIIPSLSVNAGTFETGAQAGYGVIQYNEETESLGPEIDSDADLHTILLGASAEYSFDRPSHIFAAFIADWAVGLEDEEQWEHDDVTVQTNDMSIFGQFYEGRIGFQNNVESFYYSAYLSGGWDGMHFRRKNFVVNDVSLSSDVIVETFSLWKAGGGMSAGYALNQWAVEGRAAYSYYLDGDVRNTDNDGIWFDTNGSRVDLGLDISQQLTERISFSAGAEYTLILLDESEVVPDITDTGRPIITIFPKSRTQILAAVVKLTYGF